MRLPPYIPDNLKTLYDLGIKVGMPEMATQTDLALKIAGQMYDEYCKWPVYLYEIIGGKLMRYPTTRTERLEPKSQLQICVKTVIDPLRYPVACPFCASPAYVGLNIVDCASTDCNLSRMAH